MSRLKRKYQDVVNVEGEEAFVTLFMSFTLVLVLTVVPLPLQLFSVVVQAFQAHDAVMETHPVIANNTADFFS